MEQVIRGSGIIFGQLPIKTSLIRYLRILRCNSKSIYLFIIMIILLQSSMLKGQEENDIVYLNNGDIVKGSIIENIPDDYLRIELIGGAIFTYKYSDILSYTLFPKEKTLSEVSQRSQDLNAKREVTNSIAQNSWTIHAGVKFIEYRGDNIQFYYKDESPDKDDFYTDIELKGTTIFNIGGNFSHYIRGNNFYWDLTGNLYFGSFFGADIGGSLGYPLFLNTSNSISCLPILTAGGGLYNMSLGTLENNTVYITVNETQFKDHTNVDLSLSGFYLFLKPTIAFIFDLNRKIQLRLSGSYLINIDFNPDINFNGTDQNGGNASDSEKLSESNLAFFIDDKRTNDSPFKLAGIEIRAGVSFSIGE